MARPTGWDILGLDGDPTPGVVESVQALAKEFGDFAHDVEAAYRSLNSFGSDANALQWVGQTADAFKGKFGPLPGRLQKLYTSYSEASDALSAYAPKLQAAQSKADAALRQAQDAHADLQRATTTANSAAADLKTAQQNHAANPNPQAVTDAQTAHDTAQTNLNNAKARMADLAKQANDAYNDRIAAAKACASALHHAQSDGIHNKSWWQHVGEDLSKWGGEIGKIAGEIAPILDVIALATSWIPGVDVVTAALAEADNIIALAGTAVGAIGDAMQGHWGDALLGAGMLALTFVGGRALGSGAEDLEGEAGALEGEAGALEGDVGNDVRAAEGNEPAVCKDDPIDVVSGQMLTDETDLTLPGALPVVLRRAYASGYEAGRLFGPGWASTLDQRLSINAAGIHFAGDDGQRLDYPIPADGESVLPTRGARWPLAWDRETDEIRVTNPWSGRTWRFSAVHFNSEVGQIRDLTSIADRNGNHVHIQRDPDGTPTGVESPAYRIAVETVTGSYGPRVSAIRLLDGSERGVTVKTYQYDDRGRLTGVVDSSGLPFNYVWDKANRITAWVDRVGYRYEYQYDESGRVIRTSGDGGFLSGGFAYDPGNRVTVHTNSLGHATTFRYDEAGHLTAETDPLGNTVLTKYDAFGRLLERVDAAGARTLIERNSDGDALRMVEGDGAVSEFEYASPGQAIAARTPDNALWRREYDACGNVVASIDPDGAITCLEYSPGGALSAMTDPLGAVTRFTNDSAGLPVIAIDPLGAETRITRDPFGRITSITDPVGAVTQYTWTLEGLPATRVDATGARTEWTHDAEGRLVRSIDPIGATTFYEPGPLGTIKARTGPDGIRHEFNFDSELKLIEVANPAGASWHYTYDAAGRLIQETDFIGRSLTYTYDANGRLATRTTGMGERISLDRDAVGRVVRRQTPEGHYDYSYDSAGRLLSAIGPGTEVTYVRDLLGRPIAETTNGRTISFAYDQVGRRVGRVTATGAESAWSYDAAGRAISLDTGAGRLHWGFDAAGREVERTMGAGGRLSRELDLAGRPIAQHLWMASTSADPQIPVQPALSRTWTWRQDGVPTATDDNFAGIRRYAADAAGRVTAVSAASWNETYAYDAFGNHASPHGAEAEGEGGFGPEGAGDAIPRPYTGALIRQSNRTSYTYDAGGRLVRAVRRTLDGRRKVWDYKWDSQDRLVQAITPEHGTWQYAYDALGRRTAKTRVADDGSAAESVVFTWDGLRLVEAESSTPGASATTLTWDYDPGTFRPAAQRRRTVTAGSDQASFDEAFHAIVTDLVGAPTELVTSDGTIAWRMTTTAWGRSIETEAASGVDCPIRFPGQYYDAETGLHYNLHRYYDPDIGSYLTPDPLGLSAQPNDHAYTSNPLTLTDPLGLMCPAAGGSDTAPSPVPGNIVYRNLRPDEDPLNGLVAKNPDATYTPAGHILNGSRPGWASQYISTTRSLDVALGEQWCSGRVVAIDLDKFSGEVFDLSTDAGRAAHGIRGFTAINRTKSSLEVLLTGKVPPEAMTWVLGGP